MNDRRRNAGAAALVQSGVNRVLIILLGSFVITLVMAAVLVAILGGGRSGGGLPSSARWMVVGGLVFIIAVSVVVTIVMRSASTRRAKRAFRDLALSREYDYSERGDPVIARAIAAAPGVRENATITHVFTGALGERAFTAYQQTHQLNFGHGSIPINSTVVSVSGFAWPTVWIEPLSRWQRAFRRRRAAREAGLPFENESFRTHFRVTSEDEDFLVVLLTPEVQAFLAHDHASAWYLTSGRLVLVTRGECNVDQLDLLLERLERFLDLVPDELEYWNDLRRA